MNNPITVTKFLLGNEYQVAQKIITLRRHNSNFTVLPCSLNDYAQSQTLFYKKAYQNIDFFTPDSMYLTWWLKYAKNKYTSRVYGPDLTKQLLILTQKKNYAHVLFGSNQTTLEKLIKKIKKFAPNTKIVGTITPPYKIFTRSDIKKYYLQIGPLEPDFIWIGISSPKQVQIASWLKQYSANTTILCVGAAFDIIAGTKPSAPRWMKTHGLEWLFRLITEPKRLWYRYLVEIPYFFLKTIQDFFFN